MPDNSDIRIEITDQVIEQTKKQAQDVLDMELERGRIPDENLRAALVIIAQTGRMPQMGGSVSWRVLQALKPPEPSAEPPKPRNILMRLKEES